MNPNKCRGYIILGSFYPEGELNMNSTVGEVINYYSDCIDVISYKYINININIYIYIKYEKYSN